MIVPLATLIMFSSIEAGHYYYQRHQVEKGLRDGARYAARQSLEEANCQNGTATQFSDTTIIGQIKNLTRTGQLSGGAPRVPQWADADITITITCPTIAESQTGIFDAAERAPMVSVSTAFKYDPFFNGVGVITDNFNLGGSQQATVMGI